MQNARYLLSVCLLGVIFVLGTAGSVSTQEGVMLGEARWFHQLSPLELALLPEGAWSDSSTLWSSGDSVGDPQEGWRPLSEEELNERKEELTSRALEYSAELADSLRAPYVSESLRWTGETLSSYRSTLANRYRLHLDLTDDAATFRYNLDY